MNKEEGTKIAIRFDRPLVGDVSGLTPTPIGGWEFKKIDTTNVIVTTLNSYSSSYTGYQTIDQSLTSYWRGTTSINWLIYQFETPFELTKFRLYLGSYYIITFTISGSNDGENWTQIGGVFSGASSSTAKWYEYLVETNEEYLYYKIDTLTTTASSRVYLYEIEFYINSPIGNERYFTITGQEFNYVPEGITSPHTYTCTKVNPYDGRNEAVNLSMLTLNDLNFKNGKIQLAEV